MAADDPQQIILQMQSTELERLGVGIGRRFNLFLDPHDFLVDVVVFVEQPAEVGIGRLEGVDGVPMFGEFRDQRMMECGVHDVISMEFGDT